MSDGFNLSGFPSNDPVEVKNNKKNKVNMPPMNSDGLEYLKKNLSNMDFNSLKGMIPPSMLSELQSEADSLGADLETVFNQELESVMGMLFGTPAGSSNNEDDEPEIQTEHFIYELSDISWLGRQLLGSVPAKNVGANTLLTRFNNVFGPNGENFVNIIDPLLNSESNYCTESGVDALLYLKEFFGSLKVKQVEDTFILVYGETNNTDEYGMYFVYTVDDAGGDCIYVPLFANTYNVDEEEVFKGFFNKNVESPFFNDGKFIPEKRAALDLSIRSSLVTPKNILLSPAQFGTLKHILPAITEDSKMLKVGNLVSNESTEAILLKKDADLNLEETEFPFYLNFGRVISRESLQILSSLLFKVDLNNTLLMTMSELEFKNGNLYINVDFGEFFN